MCCATWKPTWKPKISISRGGSLFAITADKELAHLVSAEHGGRAAVEEALRREKRLWALVEDLSPAAWLLTVCGFNTMATVPGVPGSPHRWLRYPAALMIHPPTGRPPVCCQTAEQFEACKQQAADYCRQAGKQKPGKYLIH